MPAAIIILSVIMIPKSIIFILELFIAAVEVVNVADRNSNFARSFVEWVNDGESKKQ